MTALVRIGWQRGEPVDLLELREWIVTNGLGGYACGTLGPDATRRYHGALVAALPDAHGRAMLLNDVVCEAVLHGGVHVDPAAPESLVEVRLEDGLPVWMSEASGVVLERRVVMPHRQNTTFLSWRVVRADAPVRLLLWPWVHFRRHDQHLDDHAGESHEVRVQGTRCSLGGNHSLPQLRMLVEGARVRLVLDEGTTRTVELAAERARGYEWQETHWCPGYFEVTLAPGEEAALVASAEPWERILALSCRDAREAERERRESLLAQAMPGLRDGLGGELVLAADQFLIKPNVRPADTARAYASGHEARTTIAGYHWFTDWGRDTMISLEGLTLVTGRRPDAEAILRTFAHYVRDGLIPNMFPEGDREGLYHTADATLWFFHAIDRYTTLTGERETLRHLLPILENILVHHVQGTRFGIGVDPKDGLLRQGEEGYQLTWMDAKVGDWVVTPRRGKAVEINALFYNALRLMEHWMASERGGAAATKYGELARRVHDAFNVRFWYEEGGHLYDVVDGPGGDDPALRPNQIFAISLPHPVLDSARWAPVADVVRAKLLTPVGLRSLASDHPDFAPRYDGNLRVRDAAYHQGTVWAWLIGAFVDAWRKVHPEESAQALLQGFAPHLAEACLGSISEIFDAEPPYTPRGCIAQAWSVAEVLRLLAR